MASIDVRLETDLDLTVFTVHGDLLAEEIIHAIQTEYASTPTGNILWDLTDSTIEHITVDGFRRVATVARALRTSGSGAKTAYVGGEDLGYGLLRMYTALAEAAGIQVQYEVFRSLQEAYKWLGGRRRGDRANV